ncbi:hypothetical protein LJC61_04315 [Ruminococcaceae bacterium OttesenSCG-928-A16]|nr:hypothetical protein [Ruminococcaceae bacterium OttesenSCG-928-A16]
MRTPVTQFGLKMAVVAAFIATALLGNAVLAGHLSVIGGLMLLPAAILLTGRLVVSSLQPVKKQRRGAARPAMRTVPAAPKRAAALVVVQGRKGGNTRPAA